MLSKQERSKINKKNGRKGGRRKLAQTILQEKEKNSRVIALTTAETMIQKKIATLVRAGMIPALGQHFVYKIEQETVATNSKGIETKKTKHVLVTDAEEIAKALDRIEDGGDDPDGIYYYVTTKEPDIRAIEMLMNRALGKPVESIRVDGEVKFSLTGIAEQARKAREDKMKEIEGVVVESSDPVASIGE